MRYTAGDFTYEYIRQYGVLKRISGNRGCAHTQYYLDVVSAFDIENTNIAVGGEQEGIMYVWQFGIGADVFIGRTWEEYKELVEVIEKYLEEVDCRIVVYVHNLSYEWQFIRSVFNFKTEDVYLVKSRKVLKAVCGRMEYRCSYLLTNMSLGEFTAKMKVAHVKKDGEEFDYSKIRYPWTELSEKELEYCENDVLGLIEALNVLMESESDSLYTIPYTSTGYVRRDVRESLSGRRIRESIESILPTAEIYKMCRKAFRGGNTHANRYWSGQILKNVKSYDRSSSYPDVQVNDIYPMTEFKRVEIYSAGELERLIDKRGKAVLFEAIFARIELCDESWPVPYISRDKCYGVEDGVYDNGRILKAKHLCITLTDVDYRIIREEYRWERIVVLKCYYSSYGKLPEEMLDVVRGYYAKKTALKGAEGEEVYYIKAKNKLNSIYGLSAQNPIQDRIKYDGWEYVEEVITSDKLAEELFATRKRQIMPYQWGVWVTAWARYRLEEGIRLAGERLVYVDTDSVKLLGDVDLETYNAERIARSTLNRAYAVDGNGEVHYMGVYENDGEYDEFITWGAKKYGYVKRGKLSVTVSGVSRKYGAGELEELGGLKALVPGTVFRKAGGVQLIYNDHPAREIVVDGRRLLLTSNVAIVPSTYTLGITREYEELLKQCQGYY